jgi:hypothetical protein
MCGVARITISATKSLTICSLISDHAPVNSAQRLLNPVTTKELIQLILDALTAFGTVGAVIVALWLARREGKEVIRGRAAERMIVQMGGSQSPPLVNIEITNLTRRPVTISNIGWRVGILRRKHFVQVPDFRDPLTFRLPTKLDYGDRANYNLLRDEFLNNNASELLASISTAWPWLSRRSIFLEVFTSGTRRAFHFRVEPELARALVNRAKAVTASPAKREEQ